MTISRRIQKMLSTLCSTVGALAINPTGKFVVPESRPALRPAAAVLGAITTTLPPAFAEVVDNPYAPSAVQQSGGGDDVIGNIMGFVVGGAINVAFVGLLLFILKFAFDAVSSTDFSAVTVTPEEGAVDTPKTPINLKKIGDAFFDDSGTGAVTEPAEKKEGKRNNMMGAVRGPLQLTAAALCSRVPHQSSQRVLCASCIRAGASLLHG
jgi:hypothetical protein